MSSWLMPGCLSPDLFGNLADDLTLFQTAMTTIFSEEPLGTGAAKLIKLASLSTVWRHCKTYVTHREEQQSKLTEDLAEDT